MRSLYQMLQDAYAAAGWRSPLPPMEEEEDNTLGLLLSKPSLLSQLEMFQTLAPGAPASTPARSTPSAPDTGGTSNWENVARRMALRRYGYTPEQFGMLDSIIERESGWSPGAINPTVVNGRQAMGIPQRMMDPSMADSAWMNNPEAQIRWLFNYIKERYGSVEDALAFKNREGWY